MYQTPEGDVGALAANLRIAASGSHSGAPRRIHPNINHHQVLYFYHCSARRLPLLPFPCNMLVLAPLSTVHCLLPAARCPLLAIRCPLPATRCLLPSALCLLPTTAHCLLPSALCPLPHALFSLSATPCSPTLLSAFFLPPLAFCPPPFFSMLLLNPIIQSRA